jgi:AraC-like DNA-binding protein
MSSASTAPDTKQPATLPGRRRTELPSDGAYLFEDELSGGTIDASVITCAAWLLELYEIRSGDVGFTVGTNRVRPISKCFGVFYPPFSITKPAFENAYGRIIGVADSSDLPAEFLTTPLLFETSWITPSSAANAAEIIRAGTKQQTITAFPSASLLSLKAKQLIDEHHLAYPAIARVAERLGVSHAHLSRQFKKDFGMTPSGYLRRLRVADAPLRLARGEEIIDVSLEVGYNDLSRFYKQFRQTTKTSPGACKTLLRPRR